MSGEVVDPYTDDKPTPGGKLQQGTDADPKPVLGIPAAMPLHSYQPGVDQTGSSALIRNTDDKLSPAQKHQEEKTNMSACFKWLLNLIIRLLFGVVATQSQSTPRVLDAGRNKNFKGNQTNGGINITGGTMAQSFGTRAPSMNAGNNINKGDEQKNSHIKVSGKYGNQNAAEYDSINVGHNENDAGTQVNGDGINLSD